MRRKTKDKDLAKRAKNLVRMWQKQLLNDQQQQSAVPSGGSVNGEGVANNGAAGSGAGPPKHLPEHLKHSGSKPASPASRPATPSSGKSTISPSQSGRATPVCQQQSGRTTSPRASSRPGTPGVTNDQYNNNNNSISQLSSKLCHTIDSPTSGVASQKLSKTDIANKRKRHRNGNSPPDDVLLHKINKNNGSDNVFGKHENSASMHEFVINGAVSKVYSHNDIHVSVDDSNSNSCDTKPRNVVSPGHSKHAKSSGEQQKVSPPAATIKRNATLPSRLQDSDKVLPRTPKVKTTAELIKEMSASGGLRVAGSRTATKIVLNQIQKEKDDIDSPVVPPEAKPRYRRKPGTSAIVPPITPAHTLTQTKNEMMEKFLQSQSPHPSCEDTEPEIPPFLLPEGEDPPSRANSRHSSHPESKVVSFFVGDDDVETTETAKLQKEGQGPSTSSSKSKPDPWSLLPPLNLAEIDWTTDDYTTSEPKPVEDSDVTRLEGDRIPGVNGQFDSDGAWHEWTDTLSLPSFNDDLQHILPYINIDD